MLSDPYTRVRGKPLYPELPGLGPNDILAAISNSFSMLVNGGIAPEHISEATLKDPAVAAQMAKVSMERDEALAADPSTPGRVHVKGDDRATHIWPPSTRTPRCAAIFTRCSVTR